MLNKSVASSEAELGSGEAFVLHSYSCSPGPDPVLGRLPHVGFLMSMSSG